MQAYINSMMIHMWISMQTAGDAVKSKLKEERGDTNLISIIIVLGIVLALVVVFRGYITTILGKIKGAVTSFNNDPFGDGS